MKKCPNCGKEFEEDINFCNVCGAELLSPNSCPKCGAPIGKDDNFCPKCGAKLTHVKVCKECGFQSADDAYTFCPKCGKPLEEGYAVVAGSKAAKKAEPVNSEEAKANTVEKLKSIFMYVTIGLISLGALLLTIGWFGDIVAGKMLGVNHSESIAYYFGEQLKNIAPYKDYEFGDYYYYELFMYIFDCILYFGGLILSFLTMGFGIADLIKSAKTEKAPTLGYFVASVLFALPHIMFLGARFSGKASSGSVSMEAGYGWGSNLLIAATYIIIFAYFGYKIANAAVEKKNFVPHIFATVATEFLLMLCLYGNNLLISSKSGSTTTEACGFSLLEAMNLSVSMSTDHEFPEAYGTIVLACVFVVFALIFGMIALGTMFNKKLNIGSTFACTLISVAFTIIGTALLCNKLECHFGTGSILAIVCAVFIFGALIACAVVNNKKKPVTE